MRNRRNSWHPDWYRFLCICADQVLRAAGPPIPLEKGDLVSIGWLKVMRYRDPVPDATVWRYCKREMWKALMEGRSKPAGGEMLEDPAATDSGEDMIETADLLEALPAKHRYIAGKLTAGYTMDEIGKTLGVCGERVRHLKLEIRDALGAGM